MYLKNIELIGFKSFAERTKLDFEPGMTAIVGPNGCGKSNISDAIRWVLGEQSAKALRGSKMEDCIFNGTELHQPLSMAEVSLTLADCEQKLGTEFNEITVTRRVFRTGEGQYFINKTACRLKDIQRLFMDTGIGTNSYSLMEQGRIDQILSSRPEDRREVFEEASGITKFKADKKEAIRKLEHTEANLLRLADIIREVRRQIISLQRQAGKARRYQQLQAQLRGIDLCATRDRLDTLGQEIGSLESRLASTNEQEEAIRADLQKTEEEVGRIRTELASTEKNISDAMEASVQAKTELDRAHELIRINQDRIQELKDLSERDSHDAAEARARLEQHGTALRELEAQLQQAISARDEAEKGLTERTNSLSEHDNRIAEIKNLLHEISAGSVDTESQAARLQNELYNLEAQERTAVIRRERLAAEQAELQHTMEIFEKRQADMAGSLQSLQQEVADLTGQLNALTAGRANKEQAIEELRSNLGELKTRATTRQAQVEILGSGESRAETFPGGARLLLDSSNALNVNRGRILGSLAEAIQAEPEYKTALESALRAWLDAILVSDSGTALDILRELEQRAGGSARLLSLEASAPQDSIQAEGPGIPLIEHVQYSPEAKPIVQRLLQNVRVVNSLSELPSPLNPRSIYVTRTGSLARGDGSFEFWMPGEQETNPLARQHQLAEWTSELEVVGRQKEELEKSLAILLTDEKGVDASIAELQARLEESKHRLAQREGENNVISAEATQARERTETVSWELNVLKTQQNSGGDQRASIHDQLEKTRARHADLRSQMTLKSEELRALEQERTEKATEVTSYHIRFAERRQQVDHVMGQKEPLQARIREMEELIRNRSEGINSYQTRIQDLQQAIESTSGKLQPLQDQVAQLGEQLEKSRKHREEIMVVVTSSDHVLHEKHAQLDGILAKKSQIDVELAEQRIRRQNMIERVTSDYRISPEQIATEPEPVWEDGHKPDRDTIETQIAELRAKIEAMGPVNLVAIEEHRELEERYTFLTQQQEDLVQAKQQLMDMIRKINKTTTELFQQTFNQVNSHFQEIFKKLFGGGSAKLVMVNEEDVLESGIEIIARPPGKKLQTVSLLSGGERTMTAVALLFSLYMVKPSPFCMLDEIDAALDEANIGRFVSMLKDFLVQSQFVVVTHNRQTIGAAGILYGVTMEQNGVSKIVSVKFSHHEKKVVSPQPEPAPSATDAPVAKDASPQPEPAPAGTDAPVAKDASPQPEPAPVATDTPIATDAPPAPPG